MTALKGIAAILLLVLLLAQLRIGAIVEYTGSGLEVCVRVGPVRIRLLPVRAGAKKDKKAKKRKKAAQPEQEKKPKGGLLKLVLEFLPLVLETVKRVRRKLQVDQLDMQLTVAAPDPADAAMQYGQANALMASLWQPITQAVHVKDGRARIDIDFDAQHPTLYLMASLSVTIGQAVGLGAVFGAKALGILIRTRRKNKQEQLTQRKAVNHGTQSSHQ